MEDEIEECIRKKVQWAQLPGTVKKVSKCYDFSFCVHLHEKNIVFVAPLYNNCFYLFSTIYCVIINSNNRGPILYINSTKLSRYSDYSVRVDYMH